MLAADFVHSFGIFSREAKVKPASKSEVRRWLDAGAVQVNGEVLSASETVDFPIFSMVVFPRGRRITLK